MTTASASFSTTTIANVATTVNATATTAITTTIGQNQKSFSLSSLSLWYRCNTY